MTYLFIRTGNRPVSKTASEDLVQDCFELCDRQKKDYLDRFFNSELTAIEFEFDTIEFEKEKVRIEKC